MLFWPGRYGAAPPPCPFYWRDCSCPTQVENRLKIIFVMVIYFAIWLTNMRGIDIFTLFPNFFRLRVRFFSPIIDWLIDSRVAIFREKKNSAEHGRDGNFDSFRMEFRLFCIYCLQNNWYFISMYTVLVTQLLKFTFCGTKHCYNVDKLNQNSLFLSFSRKSRLESSNLVPKGVLTIDLGNLKQIHITTCFSVSTFCAPNVEMGTSDRIPIFRNCDSYRTK